MLSGIAPEISNTCKCTFCKTQDSEWGWAGLGLDRNKRIARYQTVPMGRDGNVPNLSPAPLSILYEQRPCSRWIEDTPKNVAGCPQATPRSTKTPTRAPSPVLPTSKKQWLMSNCIGPEYASFDNAETAWARRVAGIGKRAIFFGGGVVGTRQ